MTEENPYAEIFESIYKHSVEENDKNRRMHELFDKLSKDDLSTLKSIVSQIARSENPAATANYWRAFAKGLLMSKFKVQPWVELASDDALFNFINQNESES